MSERGRGRAWEIPYEVGQMVRWQLYDVIKLMVVREKSLNYLSLENVKNSHDRFRVYENQIDSQLTPV